MSSIVKISYKYCTSLKKTYIADNISPTPILNSNRHITGYRRRISLPCRRPSKTTNIIKITRVSKKLISFATFPESRKRYLGALTCDIMPEFVVKDIIPPSVACLK